MDLKKNNNEEDSTIESTYNNLFYKLYPGLLSYATTFLTENEAQDVVQDAFLELWKRRNTLDMGDHISSYMYRLVYTKSINIINHNKIKNRHLGFLEELNSYRINFYESENSNILKCLENNDLKSQISKAINDLPKQCQKVFRLSYLHDMKNQEISEMLDISLRTVEAHMYKALKFLRERLKNLLLLLFCFFFMRKLSVFLFMFVSSKVYRMYSLKEWTR